MSCDRERVDGRRAARLDDLESVERELVLDHLRTCAACRRTALAADPSLVFSLDRTTVPVGEGEAESMRISVATLRRTDRLRRSSAGGSKGIRAAAAVLVAALFVAALVVTNGSGEISPRAEAPSGTERSTADLRGESPFTDAVSGSAGADSPVIDPVIEHLDRPGARIYQLTEEDLSLVMIVDESLEL